MTAEALFEAILEGDEPQVRQLLAEGADVGARLTHDPEGTNVLLPGMRACDLAWRLHDLARREALDARELARSARILALVPCDTASVALVGERAAWWG
jgi:hypothetical protein